MKPESSPWTRERVDRLQQSEIQQLKSNASRLGAHDLVALCEESLGRQPASGSKSTAPARQKVERQRLISRRSAFEARGVRLQDVRTSWGGVRESDGRVVMSLWSSEIKSRNGACNYLLWAPNRDGSRPWSDTPSGQERLKHCRLVGHEHTAEGLLVQGELLEGFIPEDRARSVHGVVPETVVVFSVEKHGDEYWAVWGKKTPKD